MLCEARCQRRQTTNLIDTKRGVGFKEFFCLTPFTQGLRCVPFWAVLSISVYGLQMID